MAGSSLALVAVCINDTLENQRWRATVRCLTSFAITTDFVRHDLVIIDNGSTCPNTRAFLDELCQDLIGIRGQNVTLVRFIENQYATYAFNHVIHYLLRHMQDRIFVRVENDIEMLTHDWLGRIAEIFAANPLAGAVSTKPFDLPSKGLGGVPVEIAGWNCLRVEEVSGYCTAFRQGIFDQLGCLMSAGRYIEDVLTSVRLRRLGWELFFTLPHTIGCYHVDRNPTQTYSTWKSNTAKNEWNAYLALRQAFEQGTQDSFVPFVGRDVSVQYPYLAHGLQQVAASLP